MNLTASEKKTVRAVFFELLRKPYKELNTFLGSLTIEDMQKLYDKLNMEDYCELHNIAYEDLTEDDRLNKYLEENEY